MQAMVKGPTALDDILHHALRQPIFGIRPILGPDGERLWLKRIEPQSLWLRLKEGCSRNAFLNDLRGMRTLGGAGLPVPAILAEGPEHVVLSDAGPTLLQMLRVRAVSAARRTAAFRAAGTALGRLHAAGFAHGRPVMSTICWDGGEATFINLDRFVATKASLGQQARDVFLFTDSYITEMGKPGPDLSVALRAYRTAAPKGAWRQVSAAQDWLAPLAIFAGPLGWLMPGGRDWQARPRTLAYLRAALPA